MILNLFFTGSNGTVSVIGREGKYVCLFFRPSKWKEKDVRKIYARSCDAVKFFNKHKPKIKEYATKEN